MFKNFGRAITDFLNAPLKVFAVCAGIGAMMLVLDGTLLRLWNLHRETKRIEQNVGKIAAATKILDVQIRKAREIDFVERQARDRFDLVGENDLVFVFTNDGND
ncbi:MAG: septum formation initiator family protein [Bdellovibrionia bacterium]